ncbi:NADH:flavin oxidoreductase/NADH oxidase family protein [Glaesserella parasuis]|uniref:NADH:flavin oxidoreductase/NADH oxidase family protein n=1 Tax=Glaesserella parasuis TaxID=738 RepID=UPI00135E9090|nr:NADH:flavin oxidoreductase/NADH oxidase family protein [Glaesserella parasuis]MCT8517449.1 NADH:flavin oxidoreductase/NADH oxidase family protein [Glaesserella parasuis]MCT8548811.1 NADH:flavin oxidoreductase/NADH oxidase family protein [Glaesserella parasuis]MCT8738445.1 NADH:flavin oxidoreductase/NADH oxidase family protein [Glaesserella parasuis]MDG6334646.1 NADH:flavin oxidoreductase/NADH oxidase family protein [Glaesserella parasuis]MDG6429014.1 NADH:flavin oxidoreductase/NADH oxidase 
MLFQPFTFANGKTAKNRFFKSAMEEQLAKQNQPTMPLVQLYDTWAKGGASVLVTGNVMVAENGKGSINDMVLTDERSLSILQQWAKAGKQNDILLIMQINHAGKQSPKVLSPTPVAPSAVALQGMDGFINPPRALTEAEIDTLIEQFATTAKIAEKAGFSGVQIHAAHGYLISQFLSPHHNRREDKWGGSLENRMRFLVEIYHAIRAAVQPEFLVGLKLNSADFQKGGFDETDSIQVVQEMAELGIDFIEISGGNYENPEMLSTKASSQKREAFFLDYAEKARAVCNAPLIITGGFRSENAMNEALQSGHLDFIGIARPFALQPDLPNQIQQGNYQTLVTNRIKTGFAPVDNKLGAVLEMDWYMAQMALIGNGKQPNPKLSPWKVLFKTLWENGKAGLSMGRS